MDMALLQILRFAMDLLILTILVYVAFLKSYFQEKGKNVATKEDIQDITSRVESVKSQLQFSLQTRLSLKAEELEALVDYFSKYSAWLSAIVNCGFADIRKDTTDQLREIRSQLATYHRQVGLAAGKMDLFVENEDIRSQHGALMIETLKFQGDLEQVMFALELLHLKAKRIELDPSLKQQPEQYLKLHQELSEEELGLMKKLNEEQVERYKKLYPLVLRQRNAISEHIKGLVNWQVPG